MKRAGRYILAALAAPGIFAMLLAVGFGLALEWLAEDDEE